MKENLMNVEGLNFKDTIIKLYQLMGNNSTIEMEYPAELKNVQVSVTFSSVPTKH